MKVLIVGAGVVGTVYVVHLAAAGSTVEVLGHGPRTGEVAAGGLCAREVSRGGGMPAAPTTSSWSGSGVISCPQPVPVCPAWLGSQRSSSWATTRQAGL